MQWDVAETQQGVFQMLPKAIARRCWCAHTPLKHNIHGLHQSQGLPASLPWSNAHDLLPFSCMLIDCCAFSPHMLLSSARFAQALDSLVLFTLVILHPSSCSGQGAEEIPASH